MPRRCAFSRQFINSKVWNRQRSYRRFGATQSGSEQLDLVMTWTEVEAGWHHIWAGSFAGWRSMNIVTRSIRKPRITRCWPTGSEKELAWKSAKMSVSMLAFLLIFWYSINACFIGRKWKKDWSQWWLYFCLRRGSTRQDREWGRTALMLTVIRQRWRRAENVIGSCTSCL